MSRSKFCTSITLILFVVLTTTSSVNAAQKSEMRSVLVTGTSTGIGRNLAETLAKNGYHVYAGVRKAKDFAALNAIENITAVTLDVTKQEDIECSRRIN